MVLGQSLFVVSGMRSVSRWNKVLSFLLRSYKADFVQRFGISVRSVSDLQNYHQSGRSFRFMWLLIYSVQAIFGLGNFVTQMHVCISNFKWVDEVHTLSSDSEYLNGIEIFIIGVKPRQLFMRAACKFNSLRNKAIDRIEITYKKQQLVNDLIYCSKMYCIKILCICE